MFLFAAPPQDDRPELTFAEIGRAWRHDLFGFVRGDLPRLIFIFVYGFILLRVILYFVNRMRRVADRHDATNPQRANELRTVAAILRATAYGVIGFIVWAGFMAAPLSASYIYEGRPFKLFAINLGYWLVCLLASGVLLALWH